MKASCCISEGDDKVRFLRGHLWWGSRRVTPLHAGRLRAGVLAPSAAGSGGAPAPASPSASGARWPSLGSVARRHVTPMSVLVITWPSPCPEVPFL